MNFSQFKKRGLPFFLSVPFLLTLFAGIALASSGEGGHAAGTHPWWTMEDTYRVLNFAALAAFLVWMLRKPVSHFLSARIKGIQEQLEELENKKAAAEKELAEYNRRLERLSKEAEDIVVQYRQQGEMAREKILKEAEAAAAKLEEQAKRNIESEFAQAKIRLETEVFEKAIAAAEKKLMSVISAEDHERLIDEYLDKVVNQ